MKNLFWTIANKFWLFLQSEPLAELDDVKKQSQSPLAVSITAGLKHRKEVVNRQFDQPKRVGNGPTKEQQRQIDDLKKPHKTAMEVFNKGNAWDQKCQICKQPFHNCRCQMIGGQ